MHASSSRRAPSRAKATNITDHRITDTVPAGGDRELTAWLDYDASLRLVRPAPAAAPDMRLTVDRRQAAKADPRTGQSATGDLDAGVYSARHTQARATLACVCGEGEWGIQHEYQRNMPGIPKLEQYWLGGLSLGGVMTARPRILSARLP